MGPGALPRSGRVSTQCEIPSVKSREPTFVHGHALGARGVIVIKAVQFCG